MARMPFHPCPEAAVFLALLGNGFERAPTANDRRRAAKEHSMLDVIMLALGLGFFALSVGYAYACDWL